MASSSSVLLVVCIFLLKGSAQSSFHPKALILPVTKHFSTLQYLTHLWQRTPLVSLSLVLDLGGQFLWNDCETNFQSSSYKVIQCGTAECSFSLSQECGYCFQPVGIGCGNDSCKIWPDNPIRQFATNADLIQDVVAIQSTDGSNPGRVVRATKFLTGCTGSNFLEKLSDGVRGMAGLGRGNTGMPSQLATAFGIPRKFAVCLGHKGVVIFGDSPYHFLPNKSVDYAISLTYTPLILNKVGTGAVPLPGVPSSDYFLGVKTIKVSGKPLNLSSTLFEINSRGYSGTKISSVHPYTIVESSIYAAITTAFRKEMTHFQTVAPISPFGLCYNSTQLHYSKVGPVVPPIDLVLQSSTVYWRIHGWNAMVRMSKDVLCLGIIDGGVSFEVSIKSELVTSIIIGGHQLENRVLQFDLAAAKLGFSSSLLLHKATCSNFNFTSTA